MDIKCPNYNLEALVLLFYDQKSSEFDFRKITAHNYVPRWQECSFVARILLLIVSCPG